MTENMKTVCVGRYLIDVPSHSDVKLSGGMIGGFDIDTVEESEVAFQERLVARAAEIEARGAKSDRSGPSGMIEARDLHVRGMVGRTFVFGRTRSHGFEGERRVESEFVSVEAHAHTEGQTFSLSMEYGDESDASLAEALLARIQVLGEGEIPTVLGFCIHRAVFVEPLPIRKAEHMVMHLGLPGHPDLGMTFTTMPGGGSDPDLLERVAHTEATTSPDVLLRLTKLRADKRSINGIDGEEVLQRAREFNFATTYGFNWETRGVKEEVLQPYLSLELQTGISERPGGKPVDTSLHEDALLVLWDSISSSIRLRKSGPPPGSAAEPQPPAPGLGAVARAGDVCPQSGWWRCNEGGPGVDVQGGQVQYIREGDRMPQALLLPRQTLWQKLRGIQPSIEPAQPTAWKLVDKRQRHRTTSPVALAQAGAPGASLQVNLAGDRPTVVGAYVRTGEPCPASGWWRCDESHALDGTRWFARGSLLPAATFQVPRGVFGRSAGPEVIQRRSTWQLVRHAESDGVAHVAQGPRPPAPDADAPLVPDEPPTVA